jgi:hypothetical protein
MESKEFYVEVFAKLQYKYFAVYVYVHVDEKMNNCIKSYYLTKLLSTCQEFKINIRIEFWLPVHAVNT